MSKPKVKTRKEALEVLWDRTIIRITDIEVKIAMLEKMDPKKIVLNGSEEAFLGKKFTREYTAEEMIPKYKEAWRNDMEELETIKELLKKAK